MSNVMVAFIRRVRKKSVRWSEETETRTEMCARSGRKGVCIEGDGAELGVRRDEAS